jgi:hypothetical protein
VDMFDLHIHIVETPTWFDIARLGRQMVDLVVGILTFLL